MKKILLLTSLLAITFIGVKAEIDWPESVNEWGIEGITNITEGEIVYYDNAFYQCTADIAVEEGNDPATATDSYTKIADANIWVIVGTDDWILAGTYLIYSGSVYKVLETTSSYSDGWSPTGWNSDCYELVCSIVLIDSGEEPVTIEEFLPANYVGYWNSNFSWLPGFHTIFEGGVYPCLIKTHAPDGEDPISSLNGDWGYWAASIGNEADLLSLEDITIPVWTGDNAWPVGAIVSLDGNYYKCVVQTRVPDGENPVTSITNNWGYWEVLNLTSTIKEVTFSNYVIKDGHLYFTNNPAKLEVQLYNITGQLIKESRLNNLELPYSGIFIVKAVVDAKPVLFKIINR